MRIWAGFLFSLFLFKPVSAESQTAKKDWTILVYLNADNNLEEYGFRDVQEMERVGSNSHTNIVVQFDGLAKPGTQRYLIEKNSDTPTGSTAIKSPVLEEMTEQDMGTARTLIDFLKWGMQTYPAQHYMVIIWSHGSGWSKRNELSDIVKGISYDDTSGNHFNTNQLTDALTEVVHDTGNRIDVLAFDACLMAMYEVADSLTTAVDLLVASEETIPGRGYPYGDFLKVFDQEEMVKSVDLVKHLVKVYGESYLPGGSQATQETSNYDGLYGDYYGGSYYEPLPEQVTLSAIDLSKIEFVKKRLNIWIEKMQSYRGFTREDLMRAASKAVSFYESDYRDLGSYIKNILNLSVSKNEPETKAPSKSESPGIVGASLSLLRAIQSAVVASYSSGRFEEATGLSIYLPYKYYGCTSWSQYASESRKADYLKLKWSTTTIWSLHLDSLFPEESSEDSNRPCAYSDSEY